MYTDSHCHITCDRLYSRIDEIIENIKAKNLTSCMIMCTSPEELERAKKVKEKYPFFKIFYIYVKHWTLILKYTMMIY